MIGGRVALAVSAFVVVTTAFAQTQVTDATGRKIALPGKIERVYAVAPPAMVLVLALAPEKRVGWTRAPRDDERAFLPDAVAALPELAGLTGRGNTANVERVLQAQPDVIVDVGSTSATYVTLAERVQAQTAIPYLLFDGALAGTPRLLREVGAAIGVTERGEALARDAEAQLRSVAESIAPIPDAQRPRVYFARGANGPTTAPRGSLQAEALALAGGLNVIVAPAPFRGNLLNVSLEEVLAARPDVMIASDPSRSPPPCATCRRGAKSLPSGPVASTWRPTYHSAGSTLRLRSTDCSVSSGSRAFFIRRCFPNRSRRW